MSSLSFSLHVLYCKINHLTGARVYRKVNTDISPICVNFFNLYIL